MGLVNKVNLNSEPQFLKSIVKQTKKTDVINETEILSLRFIGWEMIYREMIDIGFPAVFTIKDVWV